MKIGEIISQPRKSILGMSPDSNEGVDEMVSISRDMGRCSQCGVIDDSYYILAHKEWLCYECAKPFWCHDHNDYHLEEIDRLDGMKYLTYYVCPDNDE